MVGMIHELVCSELFQQLVKLVSRLFYMSFERALISNELSDACLAKVARCSKDVAHLMAERPVAVAAGFHAPTNLDGKCLAKRLRRLRGPGFRSVSGLPLQDRVERCVLAVGIVCLGVGQELVRRGICARSMTFLIEEK